MNATSTRPVFIMRDREGEINEYVRIEINIEKKDDVAQRYHIKTADFIVFNKGQENESVTPFINRYGQQQTKDYYRTYAEYDAQKAQLLQAYPSELTGSELDDYLLKKALLVNLMTDPILGLVGIEWE